MNVEIKIDSEAVQQQLVSAIVNGAIGKEIEAAINDVLSAEKNRGWSGTQGVVRNAVNRALEAEIARVCSEAITERREQIRGLLLGQLTDKVMEDMTTAAWKFVLDALDKSVNRF